MRLLGRVIWLTYCGCGTIYTRHEIPTAFKRKHSNKLPFSHFIMLLSDQIYFYFLGTFFGLFRLIISENISKTFFYKYCPVCLKLELSQNIFMDQYIPAVVSAKLHQLFELLSRRSLAEGRKNCFR